MGLRSYWSRRLIALPHLRDDSERGRCRNDAAVATGTAITSAGMNVLSFTFRRYAIPDGWVALWRPNRVR
jgi:hypothetical protein